eukprot:gene7409-11732_t
MTEPTSNVIEKIVEEPNNISIKQNNDYPTSNELSLLSKQENKNEEKNDEQKIENIVETEVENQQTYKKEITEVNKSSEKNIEPQETKIEKIEEKKQEEKVEEKKDITTENVVINEQKNSTISNLEKDNILESEKIEEKNKEEKMEIEETEIPKVTETKSDDSKMIIKPTEEIVEKDTKDTVKKEEKPIEEEKKEVDGKVKENLTKNGKKRGRPPKSKNTQNLTVNTTPKPPTVPKSQSTPKNVKIPDIVANSPRMTERQQMMLIMRSEQKNYKEFSESEEEMEEVDDDDEEESYEVVEKPKPPPKKKETPEPVTKKKETTGKKRGRKPNKKVEKFEEIYSFNLSCKGESLGVVKILTSDGKVEENLIDALKTQNTMNITKLISIEKLLQEENENLTMLIFEAKNENDQNSLQRIYSKLERDNMAGMFGAKNFFIFFIPPTEFALKRFKFEDKSKLIGAVFYLNDFELKKAEEIKIKEEQEKMEVEEKKMKQLQQQQLMQQLQQQQQQQQQNIPKPVVQQVQQQIPVEQQQPNWSQPNIPQPPIQSYNPYGSSPMENSPNLIQSSPLNSQQMHPYKMISQVPIQVSPYSQIQRDVKIDSPTTHQPHDYINRERYDKYDKYDRSVDKYDKYTERDRNIDKYDKYNDSDRGGDYYSNRNEYQKYDRSRDYSNKYSRERSPEYKNEPKDEKPRLSALEQFSMFNDASKKNKNQNQKHKNKNKQKPKQQNSPQQNQGGKSGNALDEFNEFFNEYTNESKRKRNEDFSSPSKKYKNSPPPYGQQDSLSNSPSPRHHSSQQSQVPMQDRLKTLSRDSKTPTRHLWVGRFFDVSMDKNMLRRDFERFGPIDSLNLLKDQKCAFINYENVEDAIRSKKTLEGTKAYPKIAYQQVRK